ncbi:MAG: response regulator [Candidatus Tectomicrobia bacterium]|nr:response regulator [Candidatus Tectomicrobia bacterium]
MIISDRPHILIVDDYPNNIEILEEFLEDDYQLTPATSGEEALELVQTFTPDLVLLDVMMPGIDGYETCRQMRATAALNHTKIIFVSAKALPAEQSQGYAVGADDYITKPFDRTHLMDRVRFSLSGGR